MNSYQIREYPKSRVATFDVGTLSRTKHDIIGLLEVNITKPKALIKGGIKAGHNISFYSWLLKTIADTIFETKEINALNYKRFKQVLFDEVDISIPLERTVNGQKVPLALLLRNLNNKSMEEIKREIDTARSKEIASEKDYVLSDNRTNRLNSIFFSSPKWIRMLVWKFLLGTPFRIKKNMGTAFVTNTGITGSSPGWIIPKSLHDLSFSIGSIVKKPVVMNDTVQVGTVMHLTVKFNHDVIDGVPAAKFVSKLVRNIEEGVNL